MDQELKERLDKLEARLGDLIILESLNVLSVVSTISLVGLTKEKVELIRKHCAPALATVLSYGAEFDKRHGVLVEGIDDMIGKIMKKEIKKGE